jgi:hypothetical protein
LAYSSLMRRLTSFSNSDISSPHLPGGDTVAPDRTTDKLRIVHGRTRIVHG